jgi:hypothetical protein
VLSLTIQPTSPNCPPEPVVNRLGIGYMHKLMYSTWETSWLYLLEPYDNVSASFVVSMAEIVYGGTSGSGS